jgi:septation ring formation regulator EzrA
MNDDESPTRNDLPKGLGCRVCRDGVEYQQMMKTLTEVQTRCTELLEEYRAQKLQISTLEVQLEEALAMKDAAGQKAWQLQEELRKLRGTQ